MHGIANSIARRDAGAAQEQRRSRGEVFAMTAPGAQQETPDNGFVRVLRGFEWLPGAITEFALKESIDCSQRLLGALAFKLQIGNDLIERCSFLWRHLQVVRGGCGINRGARAVERVKDDQ